MKTSIAKSAFLSLFITAAILTTLFFVSSSATSEDQESKAAAAKAKTFVKNTISSHSIVIFSKSYCPYCKRAKAVFAELKQSPHVVELDERADGMNIQGALGEILGRRTVPQVFINGKHLGGSDDTMEAYENGELAELLGLSAAGKEDL
ncbi:oxidoreductase [Lithospermum erythrorhizon]|uniref:Oxidoreductase n=1 Tax=Lithospermum erythrorhizon TaxID=34254 RepID=A0AAV3NR36_LITER